MTDTPHLLTEKRDGVLVLTMNRPEACNALSPELAVRLAAAWREFREDRRCHVAILTGAGADDFCAGGDLKLTIPLTTGARQPETEWDRRMLADGRTLSHAMLRGFELYKPVIAAVNGRALGGGAEILLGCDLRVAAEHVVVGIPEARVGLVPGGFLSRLPRQVPYVKAMEMLLVGRPFSAAEALEMGLVNHVVPRAQLMESAFELARAIAANGPLAVRKIKEGVLRSSGVPLDAGLAIENDVSASVLSSKDAREGPRAFAEKREPRFTGE